ncbi:hypothetical protein B0T11DRAFT_92101 [Plectosphaerella cucumerina]|uniref:Secreted protein n=1 Tax=Plectosphaerella cucumerina TaxID=40658 RepID=A0A8K0TN47_9PEZI|nr:hypothetical protein B0T11DRAFT_92101 [Plectosphaerella cucumerina]
MPRVPCWWSWRWHWLWFELHAPSQISALSQTWQRLVLTPLEEGQGEKTWSGENGAATRTASEHFHRILFLLPRPPVFSSDRSRPPKPYPPIILLRHHHASVHHRRLFTVRPADCVSRFRFPALRATSVSLTT